MNYVVSTKNLCLNLIFSEVFCYVFNEIKVHFSKLMLKEYKFVDVNVFKKNTA